MTLFAYLPSTNVLVLAGILLSVAALDVSMRAFERNGEWHPYSPWFPYGKIKTVDGRVHSVDFDKFMRRWMPGGWQYCLMNEKEIDDAVSRETW